MKMIYNGIKTNAVKWFGSKNSFLVLFISLAFGYYYYVPLTKIALYYHETIPASSLVFYFNYLMMLVLQGGISVFVYADVLFQSPFDSWIILRAGKRKYIMGQIMFVPVLAFLYMALLFLISLVMTIPALRLSNEWGSLITGLSGEGAAAIMNQTGYSLLGVPDLLLLESLRPYAALGFSLFYFWLVTSFLGMVILGLTAAFGRMCATIIAGVMAVFPIFAFYGGALSVGPWLRYIAPVSWYSISTLDWYHTGTYPSPLYAFIFLASGIILMALLAYFSFIKKDLEV